MARKFFKTSKISNKNKLKTYKKNSVGQIIGNTYDNGKTNISRKILSVSNNMKSSGVIEPTDLNSEQQLSLRILTAAGCSIEMSKSINRSDYSLLSDQIDTETIDNPNKIEDQQFKKIKKQLIVINSVFKSETDSIFKLDSEIPKNISTVNVQLVKEPPVLGIADKLIDINYFIPSGPTLRSFK